MNITGTSATDDKGIWFCGSDYLTFDGIDILETGTTYKLDYGIFINGTVSDNSQHLIIKNCTIDLDNTNVNAKGIYSLANSPTSSETANSYNSFLNNSVRNAGCAYSFNGNATYPDINNLVGTESGGTSIIQNIGDISVTTTTNAVYAINQNNFTFNNTIINNVCAKGTVRGIYLSPIGGTSVISGNTLSNLNNGTSTNDVYGISSSPSTGSTTTISDNLINGLHSYGNVYGVYASGGIHNVYKNKISDIENVNTSTNSYSAIGLGIYGGTTNNVYNNFICDVKAPYSFTSPGVKALNISGGTTDNIFNNTVQIDYTSLVSFNESAALYISSTPTTVDLRNNIFINKCIMTTGTRAVAFYKSSSSLTNISANSNNNLYYAGSPGNKNLIYYDGTNNVQTLSAYKTRMATRDQNAVTENVPFVSSTDLHIQPHPVTVVESHGMRITSPFALTTDYDGDIRCGETNYTGNGTAPDIGADEYNRHSANPTYAVNPNPANNTQKVSINPLLSWEYVSNPSYSDPTGYKVLFGTAPNLAGATLLNITGIDSTSFNPGTLSYSTTYFWKVIPTSSSSRSTVTRSNKVREYQIFGDADSTACPIWTFTTEASAVLDPPTNLSLSISGFDIILTWNPAPNAASYNVYRSESPDSDWTLIAEHLNDITFTDTDAANYPKCFYRITSTNIVTSRQRGKLKD